MLHAIRHVTLVFNPPGWYATVAQLRHSDTSRPFISLSMRALTRCVFLAFAVFLSACGDDVVAPAPTSPSFTANSTADLVGGDWALPYNPTWDRFSLWLPSPYDQYGIDLPAGDFDLDIEVSGGGVLTGIWSERYAHLNGVFIGPGGADAGPYAYFEDGRPLLRMVVRRIGFDGRETVAWQAPRNNDRSVSATIRVKGNARYIFSRGWGGELIFGYFIEGAKFSGSQYGRLTARRVGSPKLQVSCSPNPVERGGSTTCTASTEDPNARIDVEKWWFTGTDSRGQPVTYEQEDAPSGSWSGEMALSGTVHVRAAVNRTEPVEESTEVVVSNRDWSNETIQADVREVAYEAFPAAHRPPLPPRTPSHLGATWMAPLLLPRTDPGVVRYIQDDGPNSLLAYLDRIPMKAEALVLVSPAMQQGSDFYRMQRESSPEFSATPPCLRRNFDRYVALIRHHEGIPPNPESHAGVFVQELTNRSRVVEDIVGPNDSMNELQELWEDRLVEATNAAMQLADDPVDAKHPVPFGCEFNFSGRR